MSKTMDRAVITAFAKAILETFQTMLNLDVQARQAREKDERVPGDGVHAIIGMNGEVEGACALTLPRATALQMYKAMIGEELDEVDAMVVDAVQELNNVLIGAAKKYLAAAGIAFEFGLPKTMVGMMFATDEGPGFRNLGIIFTSAEGDFLTNLSWRRG